MSGSGIVEELEGALFCDAVCGGVLVLGGGEGGSCLFDLCLWDGFVMLVEVVGGKLMQLMDLVVWECWECWEMGEWEDGVLVVGRSGSGRGSGMEVVILGYESGSINGDSSDYLDILWRDK